MATNSAALLMCSLELCEQHFRKEHIYFLKQRWSERTVLHVVDSNL
jgi:hypothetical protein